MSDLAMRAPRPNRERRTTLPVADYRVAFESAPIALLMVLANDPVFSILAANDAFVGVSGVGRENLLGRGLFDVFPDNPADPASGGPQSLIASYRRVIASRGPDQMPPYRYDVPESAGAAAGFRERYWRARNTPVLDAEGRVEYILQSVEEITERVRAEGKAHASAFLVRLNEATGQLVDQDELMQTVARLLSEHLGLDRCAYGAFELSEEANGETFTVTKEYSRPGLPSMAGRYTLGMFGADCAQMIQANLPAVEEDVENHPIAAAVLDLYRQNRIRAFIGVPLCREGRLVSGMMVYQETPLRWLPEEVELVQHVAHRCWESIERARLTRELHASEQRLRLAQRAGRIGAFDWLMKQERVIWSPELEALYELPEGTFEGSINDWRRRLAAEDVDRVMAELGACVARGQAECTYEFRAVLGDGSRRWLRGQAQFLYDESGAPERMIGVNIDIDAQKQAEAHLRQQWQTFDTALSHTPDFIYTFDLQGRFSYVNRALLSLWQKPLEEALGKNFFDLEYPPELAARLQRQIQQVIDTKQEVRDQTEFTDPTGKTGHYEYIFVPVLAGDGRVEAVAGSTRDITERERMTKALAASEERLQQVFAQAAVAIVVFRGRDFIVEMANPSYQALFQGRELVGRRFADAVPELGQHVWSAFHQVFDTGEPFMAYEWRIPYDQDLDGAIEDHWFNVVYHPLRDFDGTVSGMVAVLSEVTVQVLARQELQRVNRELEEFAYVASHDLQEPLRMVNIYTQLILRQVDANDAGLKQYADFVQKGISRMEALIRDLLTFSRTAHIDDLPVGTADLSASLQEALLVLKNQIDESGAVIRAEPLPMVRGDTPQMAHVFQNLLSNTLKYRKTDRVPEIHVGARRDGAQSIVSVRDNGIGFHPQYAEQIFGLFKRLHKEEYPGTGLGLAICQRIVERYGGRMWAESKPGEGATFFFALPHKEER